MKKKPSSITTSKGSKDVRKELNLQYQEISCRGLDLKVAVKRAQTAFDAAYRKAKAEADALDLAEARCLKRAGLTDMQWSNRYLLGDMKAPCAKEVNASFSAAVGLPTRPMQPWTEHNAWLTAIRMFDNLARSYPDSVKPRVLSTMMEQGKTAAACLSRKQWCFTG
jgi:hypothetical protein